MADWHVLSRGGFPDESLDGVHFDLTVNASETPQLTVTDQSDGLVDVPVANVRTRGRDRMPSPQEWPVFDSTTLATRTFMFAR